MTIVCEPIHLGGGDSRRMANTRRRAVLLHPVAVDMKETVSPLHNHIFHPSQRRYILFNFLAFLEHSCISISVEKCYSHLVLLYHYKLQVTVTPNLSLLCHYPHFSQPERVSARHGHSCVITLLFCHPPFVTGVSSSFPSTPRARRHGRSQFVFCR